MPAPLTAGSEIDAWCTRCRLDLGHRIVAMVERQPKRVVCLTCDSQHNYRPPKGITTVAPKRKAATKRTASASKSIRATPTRSDWDERVAGKELSGFTQFSISRTFELGELVIHKKFGPGFVAEILATEKVSIMFREGARTLAMGKS